MTSFNREYTLDIGKPISTRYIETPDSNGALVVPVSETLFDEDDPFNIPEKGLLYRIDEKAVSKGAKRIEDNHIVFMIDKSQESSLNTSFIEIYNLSDDTVNFINQLAGLGAVCKFSAGYADRQELLLLANLEAMYDEFEGTDRVTRLEFSEGGTIVIDSLFSKYYQRGTPIDSIVNDLIDGLNLTKGRIDRVGKVLQKNIYLQGKTWDQIRIIAEEVGFKVSIQDMAVNFVSTNKNVIENMRVGREINRFTGLVGEPKAVFDNSGKSKRNVVASLQSTFTEAASGVEIKVLLDGQLRVGSLFRLNTEKISGEYRVTKVVHSGSFEGNDWYTKVTGERINNE